MSPHPTANQQRIIPRIDDMQKSIGHTLLSQWIPGVPALRQTQMVDGQAVLVGKVEEDFVGFFYGFNEQFKVSYMERTDGDSKGRGHCTHPDHSLELQSFEKGDVEHARLARSTDSVFDLARVRCLEKRTQGYRKTHVSKVDWRHKSSECCRGHSWRRHGSWRKSIDIGHLRSRLILCI
jgi:hypothetical protein